MMVEEPGPAEGTVVGDSEVGLFLSLLRKRELKQARMFLEEKAAKASSDFDRGVLQALAGMLSAVEENQASSVIWKILNSPDREFLQRLGRDIEEHLTKPFLPERERGYFSAWRSLIRQVSS